MPIEVGVTLSGTLVELMAEIRPFRALRFSDAAGELGRLLAPAAERLTSEERLGLAAEPNNVVHASAPVGDKDDRSKFVRYARASAQLSGWRRAGVLVVDDRPALYGVRDPAQPDATAEWFGLVPLERLAVVELPPRERDERLRMLEATRTHLEPALVVPGAERAFARFFGAIAGLDAAPATILARFAREDGAVRELVGVTDGVALARFAAETEGLTFSVADGAATVEAARAFRAGLGEREGPVAQDYVLAALTSEGAVPAGIVLWNLGDWP